MLSFVFVSQRRARVDFPIEQKGSPTVSTGAFGKFILSANTSKNRENILCIDINENGVTSKSTRAY